MTHAPARTEPGSAAKRRLFIRTYGCQMNVYDSERMADLLAPLGYEAVEAPEGADLVILNTCHIREKAAEKVYSELGRIKALKDARAREGAGMTVAVAGCVAQAEGEEIMRRAPVVDLVLGPQSYHKLPELISRAHRATGRRLAADFAPVEKFDRLAAGAGAARNVQGVTAFVTVQEGCDKFCTFCVVPYTRGAEWSRPVDQITDEVRALVAGGVREVTLLGQNVNAYAGAGPDGAPSSLARLVRELARIDRLERIRFTTSHPRDMGEDLIGAFAEEPKLMPYLHLPVQAGSNAILSAMNRRHTAAEYEAIIAKVRAARPDVAISGDFIVGFPGESDSDFQDTLDLARRVGYAQAFSFKYSPRPGTPAAALPRQVPEDVKSARLAALQEQLEADQRAFNAAQIGRSLPVLLERPGRAAGQLHGRSPYLQAVHVEAPESRLGEIAVVEITGATRNSLEGRLRAAAPVGTSAA